MKPLSHSLTPNDPIHFEALYPDNTRQKEIEEVLGYVKRGNSCQLIGLPGVGRSNIFALLGYNKAVRNKYLGESQKWFHFVYMDCSEVKGRPLYDVIKFILISLSYSLSERNLEKEQEKIKEFLKEAIEFKDDLILFQALKKSIDYLSIERELTIVLLFDRFDSYLPSLSPEFFTNLKILRNRAKYRFSAVFSLTRPLEDLVEPIIYAEFYEFLIENVIFVRLNDKPLTDFRFSYLEKISGKKIDTASREEILRLTGGHGKLSRIAYESLLSEDKIPENRENFLMEKSQIRGALGEIWTALNPEEQRCLLAPEISPNPEKYLEKTGLLLNGIIQIPLLLTYLKALPQEKNILSYNAESNEILKGAEKITDKFSPSEFRLLRYLLLNNEKICEKEEIINAVWKDSATQEGVTDQALDQIIYRLRKKVEDDPNNPTHIQTIKGRGYKLTP